MPLSRESLLQRASQLAQQMQPPEGSASENDECDERGGHGGGGRGGGGGGKPDTDNDSPFENDVEPIWDDAASTSRQRMTVGRALQDVPDYLKPFAQCERRLRLKDVCYINHPDRARVMTPTSYADARDFAAGTATSAATSAAQSAPGTNGDARGAASASASAPGGNGGSGEGSGRLRRSSKSSSRRERRGDRSPEDRDRSNSRRQLQPQDWAELSTTRQQAAAGGSIASPRSGQPLPVPNGHYGNWAEAPSQRDQQGDGELSRRPGPSRADSRGAIIRSTSSRSRDNHGGDDRSESMRRESSGQQGSMHRLHRMFSRSGPGTPQGRGRADSLGTPLTQHTSEGREDRSGRGGDQQVVDSEREDPAGDVETVGEGHTEELTGGGSHQPHSLEDALSSIPEDLRRTVHS